MNRLTLILLTLFVQAAWAADVVVITDARIHALADDSGQAVPGHIVIQDGRITAMGTEIEIPTGARTVDAAGRLVTPGLISAASQLGLTEISSDAYSSDQGLTSGELGAGFDIQFALNPNSMLIQQARADGITRAITLPSTTAVAPFNGQGALLHLVTGSDILEQAGLTVFAQVGGTSSGAAGGSRAAQWILLRNALDGARLWQPPETAPGLADLNSAALKTVVSGQVPLLLDVRRESDIRQAIRLKADYGIRIIILGGTESWRAASELAAADIPVILDSGADLPGNHDELAARADTAQLLHQAGVLIAIYPASGLHYSLNAGLGAREAAGLAVANGLPHDAALRALSANTAKIWGIDHRAGILAVGRSADLVMWDADPLEPSSGPVMVMIAGKEVPLQTRQTLLRDRYLPGAGPEDWPPAYR